MAPSARKIEQKLCREARTAVRLRPQTQLPLPTWTVTGDLAASSHAPRGLDGVTDSAPSLSHLLPKLYPHCLHLLAGKSKFQFLAKPAPTH